MVPREERGGPLCIIWRTGNLFATGRSGVRTTSWPTVPADRAGRAVARWPDRASCCPRCSDAGIPQGKAHAKPHSSCPCCCCSRAARPMFDRVFSEGSPVPNPVPAEWLFGTDVFDYEGTVLGLTHLCTHRGSPSPPLVNPMHNGVRLDRVLAGHRGAAYRSPPAETTRSTDARAARQNCKRRSVNFVRFCPAKMCSGIEKCFLLCVPLCCCCSTGASSLRNTKQHKTVPNKYDGVNGFEVHVRASKGQPMAASRGT